MARCETCNRRTDYITKDHIIPKWLVRRTNNFGIKVSRKMPFYRKVCAECNLKKAGTIDYADLHVREHMKRFARALKLKIKEAENADQIQE